MTKQGFRRKSIQKRLSPQEREKNGRREEGGVEGEKRYMKHEGKIQGQSGKEMKGGGGRGGGE